MLVERTEIGEITSLSTFRTKGQPRLAGARTAPAREMQLAGLNDADLARAEWDPGVQNGNSG
jgi:hypothetical protein